jgi:hypothetical protein
MCIFVRDRAHDSESLEFSDVALIPSILDPVGQT